jgi:hypothetical protein
MLCLLLPTDDEHMKSADLAGQLEKELALSVAAQHAHQHDKSADPYVEVKEELVQWSAEDGPEPGTVDGRLVDWGGDHPLLVAAARAESVGWARVLRTPRKRSGHIVLDLCSAVPPAPAPSSATPAGAGAGMRRKEGGGKGLLLRQIVSKGLAKKRFGGGAAYKLARRLQWGDVWPRGLQEGLPAAQPPAAPLPHAKN